MSDPLARRSRRRRSVSGGAAAALLVGGLAPLTLAAPTSATPTPANAPVDLIISEYVEGSGSNKALELFNGTGAEIDLGGYAVEVYSNGNSSANFTQPLSGTLADGDTFVFAHNALAEYADLTTGNGLWNGDDAIVLRRDGAVVDSLGQVGFQPPGGSWDENGVSTQNATLQRLPQVCAGDTVVDDVFDPSAEYTALPIDTFTGLGEHTVSDCGEVPEPPDPEPVPDCGDPATPIGEVQGSGSTTPIPGETVSIEGVVVGDFQEGGYGGFYVQDEGDGDPATSDGVFVYHPAAPAVALGDTVRVSGVAGENFGMTQVAATDTAVCATDGALPEPVEIELPIADRDDLERYEGMRVTLPQDLTILEYFNYGRFGEIVVGTERQYQPTGTFPPGSPEAQDLAEANARDRITIDDGRSVQNPDPAIHPNGEEFTLDNLFRGGDLVTGVTGVLDYRFDLWRVQPTEGAEYTAVNPRPEAPVLEGDVTVGAFNVLNYFTTLGDRGADDEEEFERQEAKIVAAILAMDAEVLGLVEIENNDDEAVLTLVDALNEEAGEEAYAALETGTIGTDAITTALIYQPDAVAPVGDVALLDNSVDERFLDSKNRPVLTQTFEPVAGGEAFTVAVNHLKSKGSSCDDVGDPVDPDGQGECNGVRTDAAEAMVDWLATDPTGTGAETVLVIGDLNSYDYEDPITTLAEGGYTDLLKEFVGEDAYTYVFDGQLGYLDYALANEAGLARVTDAAVWTANADEVSLIDYDTTFKKPAQQELYAADGYRASDHDAVLVGLDLTDEPVDPDPVVDRLPGEQRYDTARLIAELYPEGTERVLVANGENSSGGADALAAASAAANGLAPSDPVLADLDFTPGAAPILLVQQDHVPADTAAALEQLDPTVITVLGGHEAVSGDVITELREDHLNVFRDGSSDRYRTAASLAVRTQVDSDRVYVALGETDGGGGLALADALTGGARAAADGAPLVLVKGDHVPKATVQALETLDPEEIVLIGGEDAVSDGVLQRLAAIAPTERVAGTDRWGTAARLTEGYEPGAERLFVATGQTFPDALAVSALAGATDVPLLIAKQDGFPRVIAEEVTRLAPQGGTVVGGTDALGDAVEDGLRDLLGGTPSP